MEFGLFALEILLQGKTLEMRKTRPNIRQRGLMLRKHQAVAEYLLQHTKRAGTG